MQEPSLKMKIGIDARIYSDAFTGIGRYTFELVKRLIENHPEHEWVLFMNPREYEKFSFPKNVKKIQTQARHYSLAEQISFLHALNKEKCDLVHFPHFNLPLLYRRPYIVTIHDTTISYFPGKKKNKWWHKAAYNLIIRHAIFGSKAIISVSENTKKDIIKLYRANPHKITTIHNGLGKDFKPATQKQQDALRKKYDLSRKFILYTGVWREHKNLVRLIRTFGILFRKNILPDLQLVIAGKEDPFYPEVKETIQSLQLQNQVKLVGFVPTKDLSPLYSAASAYVFPSLYEGFGFPPLEAMSTKTPVAASKTSSIPEVCSDAALYFDPYEVSDMSQKIEKILTDEKLQKELIKKGLEQIKKYDWEKCYQETWEVYQKTQP